MNITELKPSKEELREKWVVELRDPKNKLLETSYYTKFSYPLQNAFNERERSVFGHACAAAGLIYQIFDGVVFYTTDTRTFFSVIPPDLAFFLDITPNGEFRTPQRVFNKEINKNITYRSLDVYVSYEKPTLEKLAKMIETGFQDDLKMFKRFGEEAKESDKPPILIKNYDYQNSIERVQIRR